MSNLYWCFQEADALNAAEGTNSLLEEVCVHQAHAQVHYNGDEADSTSLSTLTTVQQKVCPNQCSKHGTCVDGVCSCNTGINKYIP